MSPVIRVENLSKQYRLGQVGTGTLSDDLTRLWHRLRGKEDPFLKIGQTNDRTQKADAPTPEKKKGLLSRSLLPAPRSPLDLVWALKDINFEVKAGEVLGIIGRNGAGKSTLLKILARVTTPTTGQVKIKGRIASLLEVGTGFHPDLSGRENIYLNGSILGMRKHEITRKLDEIIDFSGCERYIDTPVKRYSSGMYVRLAFAVAAHLEPEILIVDEVLAVGDAEFQKKCLGKMKDVATDGRTVLFVSHNMGAMEKLCDVGIFMENGELSFSGDISGTITSYLNCTNTDRSILQQLKEDQNRSGQGRVKIRNLVLHNAMSAPTTAIRTGDPLKLIFLCENLTSDSIGGLSLGYSIATNRGDLIAVQYSDYEDKTFCLPPGLSSIAVEIARLPFASGTYQIGARLIAERVEEDWPKYAVATLTVEGGIIGGNASAAHSGRGVLVLESEWRFSVTNPPEVKCSQ